MLKAVRTRIIPVRFNHLEIGRIDSLLGKSGSRSRSEFVREAVRHYLDSMAEMRIIQLREVDKSKAKEDILQYLKDRKEAETFDIANELRLDVNVTMQALKELWEEGEIE